MERIVNHLGGWSRMVHDMIWHDRSQSLCSRAWAKQDENRFWKIWTYVFGRRHCRSAYAWHRRNIK